ncbi:hypothetical protein IJ541_09700 [bacterium]|nr:hypothetical protein [bacterium]
MGFLLGAFGKLAAGRRVRDLQARMMRVQTKLRRATRQIDRMSKMLETQKKMELNSLSYMSSMSSAMMPQSVQQMLAGQGINISNDQLAQFSSGLTMNSQDMTAQDKQAFSAFQYASTQAKAYNEMQITQMKQAIEEKYESLNDSMLEPLKMEEDSLQTEKDSLESQVQIAQADYEACKKMEQADAKNLAPNYTGQG